MPNYHEVVEEIRSLLGAKEPPAQKQVAQLALVYQRACQDANRRLQRCADLLARGLRAEAIQQAQTEPALLDLVGLLHFPERGLWEQACARHGQPVPPQLDSETVGALLDPNSPDQPLDELLRKYRRLGLGKAPVNRPNATGASHVPPLPDAATTSRPRRDGLVRCFAFALGLAAGILLTVVASAGYVTAKGTLGVALAAFQAPAPAVATVSQEEYDKLEREKEEGDLQSMALTAELKKSAQGLAELRDVIQAREKEIAFLKKELDFAKLYLAKALEERPKQTGARPPPEFVDNLVDRHLVIRDGGKRDLWFQPAKENALRIAWLNQDKGPRLNEQRKYEFSWETKTYYLNPEAKDNRLQVMLEGKGSGLPDGSTHYPLGTFEVSQKQVSLTKAKGKAPDKTDLDQRLKPLIEYAERLLQYQVLEIQEAGGKWHPFGLRDPSNSFSKVSSNTGQTTTYLISNSELPDGLRKQLARGLSEFVGRSEFQFLRSSPLFLKPPDRLQLVVLSQIDIDPTATEKDFHLKQLHRTRVYYKACGNWYVLLVEI